jgi:putative intracellular protease/amidase
MPTTQVLVVVTSHGVIDAAPRTGIWFTEFSEPYAALVAAGFSVTVATPLGAAAPIDPRSYPDAASIAAAHDPLTRLNATYPLAALRAADFDAVFLPGGHGPMFDLAHDPGLKALLRNFHDARKPIGAVCHGPAGLLGVTLAHGTTLLRGKRVTGFTRGEDAADDLYPYIPFALQDAMTAEGAQFVEGPPKSAHVEVDGLLITGQNPASAGVTAEAFCSVVAASVVA